MPIITPTRARELRAAATPGPWKAFDRPKYSEWHVSVPMEDGSGFTLGLFPDGVPTKRPEADARLIAAAPDLAETVEVQGEELRRLRQAVRRRQTAERALVKARMAVFSGDRDMSIAERMLDPGMDARLDAVGVAREEFRAACEALDALLPTETQP